MLFSQDLPPCPSWWTTLGEGPRTFLIDKIKEETKYKEALISKLEDEVGIENAETKEFLSWWFNGGGRIAYIKVETRFFFYVVLSQAFIISRQN